MNKGALHCRRSGLVLAAGKGTRFKSEKAKVLHELCGRPLICHVLDYLGSAGVEEIVVVVGHDADAVRAALRDYPVRFVHQHEQLGTGHAVMTAVPELRNLAESVVVVYGDAPLMSAETLEKLFLVREREDADMVFVTCRYEIPFGYGRVIRDSDGRPVRIVEESDATEVQKQIQEVNPGFYCFKVSALVNVLSRLSNATAQGEYYLTDTVELMASGGGEVFTVTTPRPGETRGINDRIQLAGIEQEMRREICTHWMREGVTLLDPSSTYIDADVKIGRDTVIQPGVILQGRCRIGEDCLIGAWSQLRNAELEPEVTISFSSVIQESTLGSGCRIGPFAYIREGSVIDRQARIGSFVEIKKSRVGARTTAAHLSYLGDAEVGSDVNIGAGTITCNFDGRKKNQTWIGDRAFIGSDSQLVAPVRVHDGAWVAAGSCITMDVPADSLGIGRTRQQNRIDWVRERDKKIRRRDQDP